jgi:Zn-dependent protease with chaperone function
VSIATCLLVYSIAVMVLGPPLLRSLTSGGLAPRLGVAAWLTAIGSVLLTWLAAGVLAIVEVNRFWRSPAVFVASCMARLHRVAVGSAGVAPKIALATVVVSLSAAAAVSSVRLARTVLGMRARVREHTDAVRLVGHRTSARDTVVVDAARPAAYCVSGRPPTIVVTSAALAALDEPQLAAVLAHERAHLSGHHWIVVTALRGLAAVFPRVALMTEGAQQVSQLLEMCADDVAARRHSRRVLLSGLVALCYGAPANALAAADIAVLARAKRLAAPSAHPKKAGIQAALTGTVALLATGPLITVVLAASGVPLCGA